MIFIFGWAFDPPHVGHTAIIKSLLAKKHPEKIIIIPSSERDDKKYSVTDEHRLEMLRIFINEINDSRVEIDDYFVQNWKGEMITRDVDIYAKKRYWSDIVHVFWTDTLSSMAEWDNEGYAIRKINKIFVPRFENNWDTQPYCMDQVENYELFTDVKIPQISSTELRKIIPQHTEIERLYDYTPKFIIPGLSKQVSQYILENRLYRTKPETKPKVLVHVCCGPDVTMPIFALRDEYEIICFWYDPNIQPKEEHDRRYEAFVKICEIENIPYIKGAYDVKHFFRRIQWLEMTPEKWEKCTNCYDMRMYVAAKLAKKLKIPYYTSSLNTSPKKDLDKLFLIGKEYEKKFWVKFLDIPFRKRWWFEKSVEYTHNHDIFRQNYCWCIYSVREGGESDLKKRFVW